jgi:hypothetical protein
MRLTVIGALLGSGDLRVVGGEPGEPVVGNRCGVAVLQRGQREDLAVQVGGEGLLERAGLPAVDHPGNRPTTVAGVHEQFELVDAADEAGVAGGRMRRSASARAGLPGRAWSVTTR